MNDLPIFVLLALSFIGTVVVYVADGLAAKNINKTTADNYFYLMMKGLICGISVLIICGGVGKTSAFSLILGAVFSIICAMQTWTSLKAMQIGPFSYTQIIIALSIVIPTVSGLFWGETITISQWIGIALVIVCIVLSTEKAGDTEKRATKKWLITAVSSSVMVGMMCIIQKYHQSSEHADELPAFLVSCFVVWVIFAAILLTTKLLSKDEYDKKISFRFKPSHIGIILATGVALSICHIVNLSLSGKIDAAILFPVINICPLMLTTLAGIVLFKERISKRRWIGIAIGLVSMIFIGGVISF